MFQRASVDRNSSPTKHVAQPGPFYSNLIEGFGRGPGRDRMRIYRTARSECEEALGWIRLSYRIEQLPPRNFRRLTNHGVAIVRMIRGLRY